MLPCAWQGMERIAVGVSMDNKDTDMAGQIQTPSTAAIMIRFKGGGAAGPGPGNTEHRLQFWFGKLSFWDEC